MVRLSRTVDSKTGEILGDYEPMLATNPERYRKLLDKSRDLETTLYLEKVPEGTAGIQRLQGDLAQGKTEVIREALLAEFPGEEDLQAAEADSGSGEPLPRLAAHAQQQMQKEIDALYERLR